MSRLPNKLFFICFIHFLVNVVSSKRRPKIINSNDADPTDFKYSVAILTDDGTFQGGGVIIHNNFVLTAAHCVFNVETGSFISKKFSVVAAANYYRDTSGRAIKIGVAKPYVLTGYARKKIPDADIAILMLERSLEIENNSDKLQAVQLPSKNLGFFENTLVDNKVVFAAYGFMGVVPRPRPNGKNPNKVYPSQGSLRFAEVQILRHDECVAKWPERLFTDNQICVKVVEDPDEKKPQGFCMGDSGSPLVVDGTLVGLEKAANSECNTNKSPGRFTRVSSFVPFIKYVMTNEPSSNFVGTNEYAQL